MKSAAVMVIDGVIRKPVSASPMTEGLLLYHGLSAVCALVLISDSPEWETEEWLLTTGLTAHASVVYTEPLDTRVMQVNRLKRMGYNLEMVVDPSPSNVLSLIREGYNCVQFIHAAYSIPAWRPDYEGSVRPWEDLAREVTAQAIAKRGDIRLTLEFEE